MDTLTCISFASTNQIILFAALIAVIIIVLLKSEEILYNWWNSNPIDYEDAEQYENYIEELEEEEKTLREAIRQHKAIFDEMHGE